MYAHTHVHTYIREHLGRPTSIAVARTCVSHELISSAPSVSASASRFVASIASLPSETRSPDDHRERRHWLYYRPLFTRPAFPRDYASAPGVYRLRVAPCQPTCPWGDSWRVASERPDAVRSHRQGQRRVSLSLPSSLRGLLAAKHRRAESVDAPEDDNPINIVVIRIVIGRESLGYNWKPPRILYVKKKTCSLL